MRRPPGERIVLRQLHGGRFFRESRAIVVADVDEGIALWLPEARFLRLTRPGCEHSILHFHHADGSFRGWYVNLEEPLRRTPDGFEFDDLYLDVWVEPGVEPRWLDEDELAEAVELGIVTPARAAAARAEGERVLAVWPFPTGWEGWLPPPEWEHAA